MLGLKYIYEYISLYVDLIFFLNMEKLENAS